VKQKKPKKPKVIAAEVAERGFVVVGCRIV